MFVRRARAGQYQLILPVVDLLLAWKGQEYLMIVPAVDQAQAALLIRMGQEYQLIMQVVDQAQAALPVWMGQEYQLSMPVLDQLLV